MSGTRTQRDHAWLTRLAQLFDVTRGERDDAGTHARVEELILGGPRRYTLNELLVQTGMDLELAGRLWRSMGSPRSMETQRSSPMATAMRFGCSNNCAPRGSYRPTSRRR
ncbi:MAG: hypothetical protein H0V92_10605 [Pseudonocardiales bacterium]|nr:hypothetical protein [Pseudonocardiales bacterium]